MILTKATSPKRVLVVLHQEHSTAGRIGSLLVQQGAVLDIRRPRFGDPLPRTMADHAGAVFFGGPMSANDSDAYIRDEIDWINVPLKENKPYLGICLGAQMLARSLGHRVYVHETGNAEIGYYPIKATSEGHTLCASPFPEQVYQWHREGFDLPAGAALLASGDAFGVQACRYGASAYGLQFHPEVTYAMICRWTVMAAERMSAPGSRPADEHRSGWYEHDRATARWTSDFLRTWLAAI
jgi:GMP synthase (glutamine-hydrolysing)